MLSLEQLSQAVNQHLGFINDDDSVHHCKWTIADSSLGGRGLVATEHIKSGEVLFVDHPLIYGPRIGSNLPRGCTVCRQLIHSDSFFKCSSCALLLCSERCENAATHADACAAISRWNNKIPIEEVDDTLMSRALTAIRALLLNEDQRKILTYLQANRQSQHGKEVRDILPFFDIPEDEEHLMVMACRALDTNAFEVATPFGKNVMSMRGLYPVSGLMNHACVPNTRHSYNAELQMTVHAVKPIRAGSEIFSCYSGVLWGTPARRARLHITKHFLCKCERCADPTERGTLLAALKCFSSDCQGVLLPLDPLKLSTPWKCIECELRVPHSNICAVQGALGSLMSSVNFANVGELESFLVNRITKLVPKTNQIVVDLHFRLIWMLGDSEGLRWHQLSESRLALKESLCRGSLRTLAALGAGDAHLRGLLLYHLHAALAERARRSPDLYDELKSEIESSIEQAYHILLGDISAPPDLELRRRYLGPGCDKPRHERFFILDS